ncbi:PH domain-containing protein [Boudabousia marimammalium]|uniref:YdbS-like PH domain-containing protein n=1 Tax=Boudabousia marimammalium TaxID=156892 RepID=A0A1Q5PJ93_9ACTO|nr:PH domain-containing protein [Boudabousia marimammalium]OKL45920.1 hypothetical protein BM477_07910 [Boudabousia marimammalium]
MSGSDSLFELEGARFRPVMPQLAKVRRIGLSIFFVPIIVIMGVLAFVAFAEVGRWITLSIAAVVLLLWLWLMWLVSRQVKAFGYYEGERELYLRSGIMFRSMTVIPYGRMQFVDLDEGPIARHYGMASVKLHTASASTDATIVGLPREEANRLRKVLSERGEALMAGL